MSGRSKAGEGGGEMRDDFVGGCATRGRYVPADFIVRCVPRR